MDNVIYPDNNFIAYSFSSHSLVLEVCRLKFSTMENCCFLKHTKKSFILFFGMNPSSCVYSYELYVDLGEGNVVKMMVVKF